MSLIDTIHRIEEKLHLRHADTGQECKFDDQAAADNFIAAVPDADKWAPVSDAPAGKGIDVDLGELRAAVAADATAPEVAAEAAVDTPAATDSTDTPAA